jgi:uncharacterized protein (TIGR00730 family)
MTTTLCTNQDSLKEDQNISNNKKITPLRICCYGSSSKNTLEPYIKEAYSLGQILGQRGHTCVNGAGSTGCMGAMNQGLLDTHGNVVGVIHEMFVMEGKGSEWVEGCHQVFHRGKDKNAHLIIVGGDDLQERKRMLVKGADALVVLPGGPGTFDELWEMACARQIGLIQMPIVCVNVNGYYDPFREMLERAYKDQFLYKNPAEILHFENTSQEAVDYIEKNVPRGIDDGKRKAPIQRKRSMIQRMSSMYNIPFFLFSSSMDFDGLENYLTVVSRLLPYGATLMAGIALGFVLRTKVESKGSFQIMS